MINERLPTCASDRPVTWTQPDGPQAARRGKVKLREPLIGSFMGTWPPVAKLSLSQEAASPGCFGLDVLELVWLFLQLTHAKEVSQVPSQFSGEALLVSVLARGNIIVIFYFAIRQRQRKDRPTSCGLICFSFGQKIQVRAVCNALPRQTINANGPSDELGYQTFSRVQQTSISHLT